MMFSCFRHCEARSNLNATHQLFSLNLTKRVVTLNLFQGLIAGWESMRRLIGYSMYKDFFPKFRDRNDDLCCFQPPRHCEVRSNLNATHQLFCLNFTERAVTLNLFQGLIAGWESMRRLIGYSMYKDFFPKFRDRNDDL